VNDNDLISAVRESVSDMHMRVPDQDIIRRGRAIRARRRAIPAAAAALAVAAGATAAAVLTGTSPATPRHRYPVNPSALGSSGVQLAAWSVVRKDGGVRVTIYELRDPAGLQRRLRADGVPASVTYYGHPNRACHVDPVSIHRAETVFPLPQPIPGKSFSTGTFGSGAPGQAAGPGYVLLINSQHLPRRSGVQIAATVRHGHVVFAMPQIVHAQPRCTG
jgi:hypothetical protein